MDKKVIWLIIGLATLSVIGAMTLQLNFINSSYRINQEDFDKHVFDAINQVTKRLEQKEELELRMSGYSISGSESREGMSVEWSFQGYNFPNGMMLAKNKGENSYAQSKFETMRQTVEERISKQHLDTFLKQELSSRNVNIKFQYGVYSNHLKKFVIADNHYVTTDDNQFALNTVLASPYKAHLFPLDPISPGMLYILFPTKSSLVWGDLWQTLLLSILFSAIILFCFGYTINIILKQKKISEMKTDFINNMTHEFKTPIATISIATDLIISPKVIGDPDRVRRFIDTIKQENKRMNAQVEKVLQMALIEREELNLNLTELNLDDIIEQAVRNASLQIESRGGTIKSTSEATNPNIEGDITHVSNIINNLLDNATKYSPNSPEINVNLKNVSNGVEVAISDKGIGMNKEARKNIFNKFYRVHTGNLHDVKGFGLGLTYVKTMMTAHKGQIEVKSELGKGSTFTLFFPFKVSTEV
jgi:two-component system, OmpR family, phosphate regulon sensor histidine kinase PhoR